MLKEQLFPFVLFETMQIVSEQIFLELVEPN